MSSVPIAGMSSVGTGEDKPAVAEANAPAVAGAHATEPWWAPFCGRDPDGDFFEIEWHHSWNRVTPRANGITGWGIVRQSTNVAKAQVGAVKRFHKCAQQPCQAMWAPSSYGCMVMPIHLWRVPEIPKPEPPPTAVAEPPPTEPAVAEPPPAEPAVAEQPPAEAAEADEEDAMKTPPTSPEPELAEPVGAALSLVSAAPVAAPMVVDLSCDAPNKSEPCQTRAQVDILRKILTLAREIRTDRVYVGYSFFILFGLAHHCLPEIWEGGSLVPLIATFAPWAEDQCTQQCGVQGVCACMESLPNGSTVMHAVSEEYPLHRCRHFLASMRVEEEDTQGNSIQAFYLRMGVALLGTVMDGDCAIDLACMMLGWPQTPQNRRFLREELVW